MRERPLCTACLLTFLLMVLLIYGGGERFLKERCPSPLEKGAKPGDTVTVTGQIYKIEIKSDYQILYIKHNSIKSPQHTLQEPKLIIYEQKKKKVHIGNTIYAKGKVSFYEPARNPGNFDAKLYYKKQNIHGSVWAEQMSVTEKQKKVLLDGLASLRQRWKETLYDVVGNKKGAALSAIMLGDKADMDGELKELYQVNGIGHILAISGLHLSFVGLGLYRILRRITGSYTFAGLGGMLFLGLYILMIGSTVSAIRALVMFLFRVGADMAGRCYDAPTAFCAAAVTTVVWRPLSLYDGGFFLSFGAILGILLVVPLFERLPFQGLWGSVGINVMLLPVVLFFFFEIPLYSTALNLFVIPLLSALLLLGMMGSVLAMTVGVPGELLLHLCGLILNVYEWLCRFMLSLPMSRIVVGKPHLWQLAGYYGCLAAVLLVWRMSVKKPQRMRAAVEKAIKTLMLAVMGGIILFLPISLERKSHLEVTMLDVGQGDGIFIGSPSGLTCFVDGGSSDVKEAGRYRIEPFLKSRGVNTLDYVFLSHGDSDHMNGIEEMLERKAYGITIKTLVLPPQKQWDESLKRIAAQAEQEKVTVCVMEKGEQLTDQNITVTCLAPAADYAGETGNAASMVLALNYGAFDMLLTGDVEGRGETELIKSIRQWERASSIEVLKVAHHGSKNSSTQEFLDSTCPKYGFISAGVDNRYGHPHKETRKRLEQCGCRLYSTQTGGAVMCYVTKDKMRIKTYIYPRS